MQCARQLIPGDSDYVMWQDISVRKLLIGYSTYAEKLNGNHFTSRGIFDSSQDSSTMGNLKGGMTCSFTTHIPNEGNKNQDSKRNADGGKWSNAPYKQGQTFPNKLNFVEHSILASQRRKSEFGALVPIFCICLLN